MTPAMNRTLKALGVIVRLHPLLTVICLAIPIFSIFMLRAAMTYDPFVKEVNPYRWAVYAQFPLILGYSVFVLLLGVVFNVRSRSSWLFHLPVSERAFLILPITSIFVYGGLLHLLIPLGDLTVGSGIVFFGAPILCFLVIKNSANMLMGILKSAGVAIFLLFLWATLLLKWSAHQELYSVDLSYTVVFALGCFIFEKRQRLLVLTPALVLLVLITFKIALIQTGSARNLLEALQNNAYIDSEKTRGEFKRLVLDPSTWDSLESYALPRYSRDRAQIMAGRLLSGEEQVAYFKGWVRNHETWKPRVLNGYWETRSGLMPQARVQGGVFGNGPVAPEDVKEPLREHLYVDWRDTSAHCSTLPFERSARFVSKLFESECGRNRLYFSEVWSEYLIGGSDDFEKAIDGYLLSSNQKISAAVRRSLSQGLLTGMVVPYEEREKLAVPFVKGTVTEQALMDLKKELRSRLIRVIEPLQGPREVYVDEVVRQTSSDDDDKATAVVQVCYQLASCESVMLTGRYDRWSFADTVRYWMNSPFQMERAAQNLHIRRVLLDERNWSEIQAVLAKIKG